MAAASHRSALDETNILAVLRRSGLISIDAMVTLEPLSGGVSSAIWRTEINGVSYCVKRALNKLNVDAEWRAPVERNMYEARWYATLDGLAPQFSPGLVYADGINNTLVMRLVDPNRHHLWKTKLLDGDIIKHDAAAVGAGLGAIHRATALSAHIASRFESQHIFHDIRLEPYILATIQIHPDLGRQLKRLAERTSSSRKCLVHGDVSPKNIMIPHDRSDPPILLDAECATFGDPAFDLAFCLNHLLLKRAVLRQHGDQLRQAFAALTEAYMARVVWEPRISLERRAAALLPALALARIDGKSPVEYIKDDVTRYKIREITRPLIITPPRSLQSMAETWHKAFDG